MGKEGKSKLHCLDAESNCWRGLGHLLLVHVHTQEREDRRWDTVSRLCELFICSNMTPFQRLVYRAVTRHIVVLQTSRGMTKEQQLVDSLSELCTLRAPGPERHALLPKMQRPKSCSWMASSLYK